MSIFVSPPTSLVDGLRSGQTTGQNYRITSDAVILLGPPEANKNVPHLDTVTLSANAAVNATSISIGAIPTGKFLSEKNEITFPGGKKAVVAAYAGPGATTVQVEPLAAALTSGDVGSYYRLMRLYSAAQAEMQNNANTLNSNNYTEGPAPIQVVNSRTYQLTITGNYVNSDYVFDWLFPKSFEIGSQCIVWGFYRADSGHGAKGLWTLQVASTGGTKREYQTVNVTLVSTDNIRPLLPNDLVYVP